MKPLTPMRVLRSLALLVTVIIAAAEALHQRAARSAIPRSGGSAVVVVLGYPTHANGRPHPLQSWRVRLGIRTMRATSASHILFTGGATANTFVEAETMAALARAAGVPASAIMVEPAATSTWQNVAYSAPLVRAFDRVIVASDPLHAARARDYWIEQHPNDAKRIFISTARRPFESIWASVPTAAVEVLRAARQRWRRVIRNS